MGGSVPIRSVRAEARDAPSEVAVYQDRARRIGVPFASMPDGPVIAPVSIEAIHTPRFAVSAGGVRTAYIAPEEDAIASVLDWLACYPAARRRLRVSTPSAIRAALLSAAEAALARNAVSRLARSRPDFSARRVVTIGQVVAALAAGAGLAAGGYLAPVTTALAVNIVAAALFFGVTALRLVAAGYAGARPLPESDAGPRERDDALPVYTVLVPLRGEAVMVPELIAALDRIDWPHELLDIKLVLESGDDETIAAARRFASGPQYEIVVVPPVGPRTKPKALCFAFPLSRGEFVTVYDAEDRPHPEQLREAFATFSALPDSVACLQSPLLIDNRHPTWLSRSFAIEYAAIFDAILPTLAINGMPLPLGGTSNHFRRAALQAVGGWDPYNVTEDADLGIRLARLGYACGTLDLPTSEDAPTTPEPWLKQRTRWSKGWMQTWLVHTRSPAKLIRDLGWRGFLGFNLISTGLIASSLLFPVYLAMFVAVAADPLHLWGDGGVVASTIVGVNAFNLFAGYVAMVLLGRRALKLRGRQREAWALLLLPVYWLMVSLATYYALFQLIVRPHHWHKTPHVPRREAHASSRALPAMPPSPRSRLPALR